MKKLICLLTALCLMMGFAAMAEEKDRLDEVLERGVLIVGTEGTYNPNSYHLETGELVGFDVEVARGIAAHMGVEVEFFESEWSSLFASLDSGRIDTVINEVEYNEDRALKYDFSQPYTFVHGALLVSADNDDIHSFEDLSGKKCAQNLTSSWGALAESYGAELVSIEAMQQSIQMVTSGRADGTLNAETTFYAFLQQQPDAQVKVAALTENTTSSLVPVVKGNDRLLAAFNQALDEMRESGELTAISEKYFGADVTNAD